MKTLPKSLVALISVLVFFVSFDAHRNATAQSVKNQIEVWLPDAQTWVPFVNPTGGGFGNPVYFLEEPTPGYYWISSWDFRYYRVRELSPEHELNFWLADQNDKWLWINYDKKGLITATTLL